MDLGRLLALWRGEITEEYGEAAIWGTLAIALKALGRAREPGRGADPRAEHVGRRDRASLDAAA